MCGRITQRAIPATFVATLGASPTPIAPRFNFAPTQVSAVVHSVAESRDPDGRLGEGGDAPQTGRRAQPMQWGLIPSWAKEPPARGGWINARGETAAEKPSFRDAFRSRRCLVPADGFYEWQGERGAKVPHLIERPGGRPFTLAGLWERWTDPRGDADPLLTFTVLTTEPNATMSPLHDRMPVILDGPDRDAWLDPDAGRESLQRLIRPAADDYLHAFPVSRRVNNPKHDDPSLAEPAD